MWWLRLGPENTSLSVAVVGQKVTVFKSPTISLPSKNNTNVGMFLVFKLPSGNTALN